ncbi:MAG: ester cyclase, partial [Candidatus Hinthialibacter sp.]
MTEQELEQALIAKLTELKYTHRPDIRDRAALEGNFRRRFEALNRVQLTDGEFKRLLDEIISPDVFTAATLLREINSFTRDGGAPLNYTLVNIKDWCKNTFEIVRQFLDEFMNKKNLSFADQVMSPDFVDEDTGMGLEAFKMAWGGTFNAIPDAYVISDDLFASGDKVVHRATVGGTHMGDLVLGDMNIPATGKPFTMTSICIFQVQDGKITRHWSQMDMLGMLEQLGVMPPSKEFYGWTEPSPITGDPGDPDANLAMALSEIEGSNQGDMSFSFLDEIYSPDVIVHNPNRPDITNLESYKNWYSEFISWDQSTTINLSFAAGDKVVLTFLWEGAMPDTGRRLVQPGMIIYRIADGKIVEVWYLADYLSVGMQMMAPLTAEEMLTLEENTSAVLNAHNVEAVGMFWTDDIVFDNVAQNVVLRGKEAFMGYLSALIQGFPDYHMDTVRALASESEQIMVRDSLHQGTHQGEFFGIPATGNSMSVRVLFIHEFQGNKIARDIEYMDSASIMMQLGVMPPVELPELIPSFTLPDPVPTGLSPLEANVEALARWNSQDLNHFAEMIHPDGEFMSTLTGTPLNREQFIAILEYFFSASSDLHSVVDRMVELNDGWVLTELRWVGTSTGPYLGAPATGLTYNVRAAILYRIDENGLVTNFENYWDHVTQLSQTGVIPTTAADMKAASAIMSDLIRAQDLDHFLNYFTDDCVYDFVPYSPAYEGKDAIRSFFEGVFQSYPNFNPMNSRMFTVDNILVSETDVTGTDSATGMDFLAKPLHIWESEGSRIDKVTEYVDLASILMQ